MGLGWENVERLSGRNFRQPFVLRGMNHYYNFVKIDDFCSEVWYDLLMDNQELSIECEYNIINGNG